MGLKENVIIGKLIPAGTGMKKLKNIRINTEIDEDEEEILEIEARIEERKEMKEMQEMK